MSVPPEGGAAQEREEPPERGLPPSPASQLGRLRQSRGAPRSRRPEGPAAGADDEEWQRPVDEGGPVEPGRPAPDR